MQAKPSPSKIHPANDVVGCGLATVSRSMLSRADSRLHRRQPMQSPRSPSSGSRASGRLEPPQDPIAVSCQICRLASRLPTLLPRPGAETGFVLVSCSMFAHLVRSFACSSRLVAKTCRLQPVSLPVAWNAWRLRTRQCFPLDDHLPLRHCSPSRPVQMRKAECRPKSTNPAIQLQLLQLHNHAHDTVIM